MSLSISLLDYNKFSEKHNYQRGQIDKARYQMFISSISKNFINYKSEDMIPVIFEIQYYAWSLYIFEYVKWNLNFSDPLGRILRDVEKNLSKKNQYITGMDNQKWITHHGCFFMSFSGK